MLPVEHLRTEAERLVEAARDPRISPIFYYFAQHTDIASGRTVGRKIGVVQEILCKKLLQQSVAVRDALVYEPKVQGRSGATHKVEFILFQPLEAHELSVGVAGHPWVSAPSLGLRATAIDAAEGRAHLEVTHGTATRRYRVSAGVVLALHPSHRDLVPEGALLQISAITDDAVRVALLDGRQPVASVESKRVGAQRFSGSDNLGSGIQTIEKAKQASLVAVDFDLRFNGSVLPLMGRDAERPFRSFVVLGNGVHWTVHDLAVLGTYVDYTFLAQDAAILRYSDWVRARADAAGEPFFAYFMRYFQGMTKTPPDAFAVTPEDFAPLVPAGTYSLLGRLEEQIRPYPG
jgi:hypothetical protein